MSKVEIDPEAVVATASGLGPFASEVSAPSTAISGLSALTQAPLAEELDKFKTAWSKAVELLGKDVGLVGEKVSASGKTYSVKEKQIHSTFAEESKEGVNFTPVSEPGSYP